MEKRKYKIVLIGDQLSNGGAERVQGMLSLIFDTMGIEVHHVIVIDEITYEYTGKLLNLGKLKNKTNGIFNKLKRLYVLKQYLDKNDFDFIIDFRVKNKFLQEYFLTKWIYMSPYIISIRSFNLAYYLPKQKWFARKIYNNAFGFITVTKAVEKEIKKKYGFNNIRTIYNPVSFDKITRLADAFIPYPSPYLLAVGRMHAIKQFDHVIKTFHDSVAIKKGYKLLLIGDGEEKNKNKELAKKLNITDHVIFIPFQKNIFPYFKNAHATILTSKNEGFPNILIESLACNTPIIAYDCKSGPNEIIKNRENGLLVRNQSIPEMTNAINEMIENEDLHASCKLNAKKSIAHLEPIVIGKQWLQFLKIE